MQDILLPPPEDRIWRKTYHKIC